MQQHYPALAQVACFDTAFHRHMPELAQRYPLVRSLWHEGVRRYGFHGLSYEYIVGKLGGVAGAEAADGRVIIAHLGNGASMAAVRGGQGVDTTMGFTPAGGLMMGTRSGDLDPGVLVYLLVEKGRSARDRRLPGEPALRADRRLGQQLGHARPALAARPTIPTPPRPSSCTATRRRKHLGGLAAVLGGLDTLVFTAGVGANAADDPRADLPGAWSSWASAWTPSERGQCGGDQRERQPGHGARDEDRRGVDDRPAHVCACSLQGSLTR